MKHKFYIIPVSQPEADAAVTAVMIRGEASASKLAVPHSVQ